MSGIRVRFAPSPTGELHIGGARTALFNWLFARKEKGTFIIRIDDTDVERSQEKHWRGILEAMHWLGLDWDEGPEKGGDYGPYFQSQRYDLYRREINRLLEGGLAYPCYCSVEKLKEGREEAQKKGKPFIYPGTCRHLATGKEQPVNVREPGDHVIRFKTPDSGETLVNDQIRGEVRFENRYIEDFIILKSNGVPTYNFASVVDDRHMLISHVIRAEEHLTNTPRQLLTGNALGFSPPEFAHVPMILAPDRSKLSKRHGATSVQEFKDKGFFPEALVNYLALLGWSPPGEEEILPLDDIIKYFSLNRVVKTAAIYDIKKIVWINGHYFRNAKTDDLVEMAIPFLQEKNYLTEKPSHEEKNQVKAIIEVMHDRVKTLEEFAESVGYFFQEEFDYDAEGIKKIFGKEDAYRNLEIISRKLEKIKSFNRENLENIFQETCTELDISTGRLNKPVRFALSGSTIGPDLMDMILILGKEKTIKRLSRALDFIQNLPAG